MGFPNVRVNIKQNFVLTLSLLLWKGENKIDYFILFYPYIKRFLLRTSVPPFVLVSFNFF